MGDKITSHNQSGGITAKNVASGSGGNAGDLQPPKSRRFKFWAFIGGAIGLVASVIAIYEFFW